MNLKSVWRGASVWRETSCLAWDTKTWFEVKRTRVRDGKGRGDVTRMISGSSRIITAGWRPAHWRSSQQSIVAPSQFQRAGVTKLFYDYNYQEKTTCRHRLVVLQLWDRCPKTQRSDVISKMINGSIIYCNVWVLLQHLRWTWKHRSAVIVNYMHYLVNNSASISLDSLCVPIPVTQTIYWVSAPPHKHHQSTHIEGYSHKALSFYDKINCRMPCIILSVIALTCAVKSQNHLSSQDPCWVYWLHRWVVFNALR